MEYKLRIDITGQKFGRLKAIRFLELNKEFTKIRHFWQYECDCGKIKIADRYRVSSGSIRSCGCLFTDVKRVHGFTNKKDITYQSWASMKSRCNSKSNPAYHNYGGRGITICNRWKDFNNFLNDLGTRPTINYQLDRIDNNGNYEPPNCRWATKKEQANNRRRSIIIERDGIKKSLKEWCNELNINYSTACYRLRVAKWSKEEVLRG